MPKVNKASLYIKFEKSKAAGQIKKELDARLNAQFEEAKQELLEAIKNDPVSVEIDAGPRASPSFLPKGNLFSFIGFRSERKPIFELLQLLKKNVRAKPSQFARVRGDKVIYFKQIQYPRIEDIENSEETLYDGWAGNFGSWVRGIRRGISGYSHYLFSLVQKFNTSRSGSAIQVKDSFDQGEHEPKEDYIEKDIKNFKDKVRSFRLEGSRVSVR